MNESRIDTIRKALIRAGRREQTPESPPHFETRLMAAIRERKDVEESPWILWNRIVWRLVPVMAVIVLVLAGYSFMGTSTDATLSSLHDPLGLELAMADNFLGDGL